MRKEEAKEEEKEERQMSVKLTRNFTFYDRDRFVKNIDTATIMAGKQRKWKGKTNERVKEKNQRKGLTDPTKKSPPPPPPFLRSHCLSMF